MPSAKKPAAMNMKIAGVQSADSGTDMMSNNHNTAALIDKEMKEPVMALDSIKPRRMKMCAMEKKSAA